MYCSSCGKMVPEDSTFCPFCGGKVSIPQQNAAPDPKPETSSAPANAKKSNTASVILSILLVVAIAAAGYFFYMYQNQNMTIANLNSTVDSLNKTISSQKTTINNYKTKADGFDVIASYGAASYNKGYALANFKADKDIVVVKKGSTASFTLTAYLSGGVTISSSVADTSIATVSYDADTWYTSVGMTVRGVNKGATTVTFSNSAGSSTFTMLLIVV